MLNEEDIKLPLVLQRGSPYYLNASLFEVFEVNTSSLRIANKTVEWTASNAYGRTDTTAYRTVFSST